MRFLLFASFLCSVPLASSLAAAPPRHLPLPWKQAALGRREAPGTFSAMMGLDHHARLSWSVPAKHPSLYFEVERSIDGTRFHVADRQPFEKTDTISTGEVTFEQRDSVGMRRPTYYRLCIVDRDYHRTYSPSILLDPWAHLEVDSVAQPHLRLWPQPAPAGDSSHVQVEGSLPRTMLVSVRNRITDEVLDTQLIPYNSPKVWWNLYRGRYVLEAESNGRHWVTYLVVK